MGPKLGTKPEDVRMSPDDNVNEMLHKFDKEFAEGMANDDDDDKVHDVDDSVPLEKRDDHLND